MTSPQTTHPMEMRCSIAVFRDDNVLLIHSIEDGTDVWKLPGGHLRSDEGMFHCALRELKEETGLTADLLSCAFLTGTRDKLTGRHVAELVMLARAGTPGEPRAGEAGLEPRFVPVPELPGLTLMPPIAVQLRGLFGHDNAPAAPYPDLLQEQHGTIQVELL
ncbi:NUDIX hydrolase [Streptacidiphilus sp. 4-A2]|nr:NUDIX hydrolase [Streptacidiphilus sp. 4-A2]